MRKRHIATAATALLVLVGGLGFSQSGYADDVRYYDREHRDYHYWNNNEDRAYRSYREGRHESYREFQHISHAQQRHYWTWRHEHPDL